jgi:predicted nucleotidyltransferase
MLTTKQLAILEVFRKNLGKKLTFKEIRKETRINSNDFLQRALKNCMKEELVTVESVGRSILFNLELTERTMAYFSLIPFELYRLPGYLLEEIQEEISKETAYFSLVIFGSYAKRQEKKDSDLDILIFIENEKDTRQIQARIESIKRRSIIELDAHIISVKDFREMLANEEENLGKEIARNHLVYSNTGMFYKSIEKWIRYKDFI